MATNRGFVVPALLWFLWIDFSLISSNDMFDLKCQSDLLTLITIQLKEKILQLVSH